MTGIEILRAFFEADGGRKLTVAEMKPLTKEARGELVALAAAALGVPVSEPVTKK